MAKSPFWGRGKKMKRKWILSILCVFVMVCASTNVSAVGKNFGTATTDLWDDSVNATAPDVSDWVYSHEEWKTGVLDVEVTCEFVDYTSQPIDFEFLYNLRIELWQVLPPPGVLIEVTGEDYWHVDDSSSNYLNNQVYDDTLSVEIEWHAPGSYMYKCILEVYIYNDEVPVNASDSDTWWITMAN